MSFRTLFRRAVASPWEDRTPIRSELFSIERLEEHATSLAAAQPVSRRTSRGHALANRLADNAAFLLRANLAIAEIAERTGDVTPAAEWLIDNYHLVDMQIREIDIDLPRGYYAQLPKLADGPFAGLPRVFGATWSLIAHTDSHFDPEALRRYLLAYQLVQPLTIGELWAVPITLRIVLIENLRRVAEVIAENSVARHAADTLADSLIASALEASALEAGAPGASSLPASRMLAPFDEAALTDPFAVQLAHRLRGQDPKADPALAWLDQRLAAQGTTIETVVRDQLREQGAFNATIRNIINSLRFIAAIDWTEAFEKVSPVDAVLAGHGCYTEMDFTTRNLYRTAIEVLARGSGHAETAIARLAVEMAASAAQAEPGGADPRGREPGYHLLAEGRPALERALGFHPTLRARVAETCRAGGIAFYGAAVILLAAIFTFVPLWLCLAGGMGRITRLAFAPLAFIFASDAAVACLNRAAMRFFGATPLPGLELRGGISGERRTLVAVPTLLTDHASVEELVARLEVHFLASQDGDVHFALVSDWADSPTEHADDDAALLATAAAGIARLNARHGPIQGTPASAGDRFLLLHRKRVWNHSEQAWIGWERKRGKLHELNLLLRGNAATGFLDRPELPPLPTGIRYVVTLDSDTRLPHEAVRRLVGKMCHPLNAPYFDAAQGRVTAGYALLQPRVTPSLPVGRDSSPFQRIYSSMDGIDPYAAAMSDVYQDMLGEGSYAGKGIYEIDAFEAALHSRVPDSTLLSHDLFEGVYARAGLASDVEVLEEFPTGYALAALRQHRWARGDWQLLPWILAFSSRRSEAAPQRHIMPAIGRWKMLDNLRRTLSAPAAILVLLLGWRLPTHAALVWTGFVLAAIALPVLLPVIGDLAPRRQWITWRSYVSVLGESLRHAAALIALTIAFLAHQALLMADAIARTLVRICLTRRHLLQWVTAAQAGHAPRLDLRASYRRMAGAPVLGLAGIALASHASIWADLLPLPFALLWIASPAIALWASASAPATRRLEASPTDIAHLRATARRTWRFFETFVTPADNMLPPDNFQEDPAPVLAHRTSPTNLGLYLLSAAAAHDFGWAGLAETAARLEATLATMGRLARYRGHLYNWYDTTDLRPLDPAYVSTVDSGNLAGHLIALAVACRDWRRNGGNRTAWRHGLADILAILAKTTADRSALREPTTPEAALHARFLTGALDALAMAVQDGDISLAALCRQSRAAIDLASHHAAALPPASGVDLIFWVTACDRLLVSHQDDLDPTTAAALPARLRAIETAARAMANAMEFGFLRNDSRKLLSIGFTPAQDLLDENCYDLLASEARLAVFFAIAKGDIAAREWFRLGRAITPVGRGAALVSWSGSMFEYLMPSLVMRAPAGSLLEQTSRLVVQRQIAFGAEREIPWGVSESAYNVRDLEYTYQYSNFGIPGIGLKRGLGRDAVVAPYATCLAAMVDPQAASHNLARLERAGGQGRYGFYEALDYTPARLPAGQQVAVVRAFMAHHQGMSILAIADTVLGGIMRIRFHAEPMIRATELLLQERAPRNGAVARALPTESAHRKIARSPVPPGGRSFSHAGQALPATHLLSNGRLSVMLTAAGSGYRRWQGIAVTRWREDATLDDWGPFIYLRDLRSNRTWSAGLAPTGAEPDASEISFSEDRAEFIRRDGTLTTAMEILISAESDAEIRRITLSNAGAEARLVEITSYAELALAAQATDIAHPAFAKLFVQTEHHAASGAILATRRRRDEHDPEIWAAHLMLHSGAIEHETDRAKFLGRGNSPRNPAALRPNATLSGTTGTVLDPIFALRGRLSIPPGGAMRVTFWTIIAATRAELIDAIDKHRDDAAFDRASTLAWTQAQVQLRHLGITPGEADLFQRLAGHLIFAGRTLRPKSDLIRAGAGPQSALWAHGISGDRPILLLRIADADDLDLARHLLLAHEYFQLKRLAVDLVILNDHPPSYAQDLQIALEALIRTNLRAAQDFGAVYLLRADLIPAASTTLLTAIARIVLIARSGRLSDQLDRADAAIPRAAPRRDLPILPAPDRPPIPPLEFFNGHGGFTDDAREYLVILAPGATTPAPWINVIANPDFGFHASAEGAGYTWAGNSRDNQLTPWSNDPVTDRPGEAFFLQDTETGTLWCPTAALRRDPAATYLARHGHGTTRYDRVAYGIASTLLQYVAIDDPVKITRLRLHNLSGRPRTIAVTAYAEWVLGAAKAATTPFIVTEIDPATGALFARNPWNITNGQAVAFADLAGQQTDWTADRAEFIGRNGDLSHPAALGRQAPLSNTTGAALDPCAALRTTLTIPPDGRADICFLLGQCPTAEQASALIAHHRAIDPEQTLADIRGHWNAVTGAIQVKTPNRAMDIMLNGWLLYQTLSCRIWARSGFYQASGAFGFRDQLQDGMALAHAAPAAVRAHILCAASRQFTEGDVQHWWLPQTGTGVRTRISDDRAWLAYTTAQYVTATADTAILDAPCAFLEAPLLAPEEHDRFFLPATAPETAPLYDHCARALDHSLALGTHNLPLMGTGDWNDGMNRVGAQGRGESIWLGWFLHAALTAFARIADQRGDIAHATSWRSHAAALVPALDAAWDGAWYLRAWFDDGTPLGSHANEECRIDAIAQSWAVISAAGDPARAASAMQAVEQHLVRPATASDPGLVLVLAPPFDGHGPDPGYIGGYPPGIRENGGQYTHAALWTVMATALLGDATQAHALFARLNPINHALDARDAATYKLEPYVIAADIYATAPHQGRGGWSWYTGSAGWMQRIGIETLLGIEIRGTELHLNPIIPGAWPGYQATLAWKSATYRIAIDNTPCANPTPSLSLDGIAYPPGTALPLSDDGATHTVNCSIPCSEQSRERALALLA